MYRVRLSGEIKSRDEIRKMFPNVSLPRVWDEVVCEQLGIDLIFDSSPPATDRYEIVYQDGVEQVDGKWVVKWAVSQMNDQDKVAFDAQQTQLIREDRDRRLAQTDWMALSDNVMSQDWVAYRQALRDLPLQEGFPYNVTWPVRPDTVVWPQPE